ncbi:hypothetical protein THAOC_14225, partial [Thalassiosira oceanica]
MGRRNRSSSIGQAPPRPPARGTPRPDPAPCRALLGGLVHASDAGGRTAVHRAVVEASPDPGRLGGEEEEERARLDGLYLLSKLPERASELDRAEASWSAGGGGNAEGGHLGRMMLARDGESGYTPLHLTVARRDLTSLLVLLDAASSVPGGTTDGDGPGGSGARPPRTPSASSTGTPRRTGRT